MSANKKGPLVTSGPDKTYYQILLLFDRSLNLAPSLKFQGGCRDFTESLLSITLNKRFICRPNIQLNTEYVNLNIQNISLFSLYSVFHGNKPA